jgi:hypothetical protein
MSLIRELCKYMSPEQKPNFRCLMKYREVPNIGFDIDRELNEVQAVS